MEWTDEGLVLARRRHGESSAIVSLFTRARGRHLGLVRGGAGSRAGGLYQPGNLVTARWRARLEDQLGGFSAELAEGLAARALDDADALAALAAATAVLEAALPERAPFPALYADTLALLRGFGAPRGALAAAPAVAYAAAPAAAPAAAYARWEARLLGELGFGLDLAACAATGVAEGLEYVSPRSGRAVSEAAGRPWADRLLRLPRFLADDSATPTPAEIESGLALTAHFLERHVLAPARRRLPQARLRLAERGGRVARPRAS